MIKMNDFTAEPKELGRRELAAIEKVLRSGRFILDREVEAFEQTWAKFCGTRFCAGVGNGMEAIELGLRALDIGRGDEVITTPMTAMASVIAIMRSGATPVLADVDPGTALLNRASAERCLTQKTKAVLLVHLYGQISEMEDWMAFCRKAKIHLLEDCAQAHGANWNGIYGGGFATWGAYSFYPTKNLGARGDAGAVVIHSEEIAMRVKKLRNYGMDKQYEHPEAGLNSRLDELQAAVLSVRVNWLQRFNARRQEIARKYLAEIRNPRIELLAAPAEEQAHVYYLFVVRCRERNRLAQFLTEREIETSVHYPIPAHLQGCCQNLRCDPHGLPNVESHAMTCLSIPCHPQLRDNEVSTVITAINPFE
jgi:dTDP-4-amino-4,6-dideoxygalactose transaminase